MPGEGSLSASKMAEGVLLCYYMGERARQLSGVSLTRILTPSKTVAPSWPNHHSTSPSSKYPHIGDFREKHTHHSANLSFGWFWCESFYYTKLSLWPQELCWVLWVLLVKHWIWGWIGGPPTLQTPLVRCPCLVCSPSFSPSPSLLPLAGVTSLVAYMHPYHHLRIYFGGHLHKIGED
jgi:hypothetical protein